MNNCRFCNQKLTKTFIDLGISPLANSYVPFEHVDKKECFFPLHVYVCTHCLLVQLNEYESPEAIFSDYSYFSSYSSSWLEHCRLFVENAISRWQLDENSFVIEIASNDGYLLQYFNSQKIPCLGVEPAENVAKAAISKGVYTKVMFWEEDSAKTLIAEETRKADLIVANNVMAHVPNLNSFVKGFKHALAENGVISVEFPHLLNLINEKQFDTIYHEHFSYFSILFVEKLFDTYGLKVFDAEELPTHGGSLRVYGAHKSDSGKAITSRLEIIKKKELSYRLDHLETYDGFAQSAQTIRQQARQFFLEISQENKKAVVYGAAAKGNTFLNFCGISNQDVLYAVDRNPHKQNCFLPGTRIPVYPVEKVFKEKPDYLVILPWNLSNEIEEQMAEIKSWGGQFTTFIPELKIF